MTASHELSDDVRIHRHGFLGSQGVRQALMVHTRGGDGMVDRHPEDQVIEGDLLNRGDDAASARCTQTQDWTVLIKDDGWGHRRYGSPARAWEVGGGAR